MPREDLVLKAKEETIVNPNQQPAESAHTLSEAELVELVKQAAQEIEASDWSPIGSDRQTTTAPGDWPEYQLPHGYNRTRIMLLVRDPYWLHCYWEIGSAEREAFRGQIGRELWELPNILRVHDLTGQEGQTAVPLDIQVHHEARSWYTEIDRPGHTFQAEIGADVPGRGFVPLARSNIVCTPTDQVSEIIDEEWMIVEEDFRRLYRLAAGIGSGYSSQELMESLTRRLARQMGSGAVSSLGSGFRLPGEERRFWLVVGTELIVHGATQADAMVTIDGTPIQLRPDGTFSARFALPDGERSIPVTAKSGDGLEAITITPVVRKETH